MIIHCLQACCLKCPIFKVSLLWFPGMGMLYKIRLSAALTDQYDTARNKKSSSWASSSFWVIWYYLQYRSSIEEEEEEKKSALNFSNLASRECVGTARGGGCRENAATGVERPHATVSHKEDDDKPSGKEKNKTMDNDIRRTTQIGLAAFMFPFSGRDHALHVLHNQKAKKHVKKHQANATALFSWSDSVRRRHVPYIFLCV